MLSDAAIAVKNVSKTYKLYGSMVEQALDVLGLSSIRFWRKPGFSEYPALNGVSLTVARGERVGIVGRNGAGKTTLLKLITGNFQPTSGTLEVHGNVQALMSLGLGFHPEFTGFENVRSSLAYNGLSGAELEAALTDVVDFAELGEHLHQPLKTYSQGMQARLMFAASTAVRPDILIIDEILGAGDAYFSAKSSHRMESLAATGCTLILVSHSMQQVLQFCDRAIWLEKGEIAMEGESLAIVKAYEEFAQRLDWESSRRGPGGGSVLENKELRKKLLEDVFKHQEGAEGVVIAASTSASSGGVSRWTGEPGIKIESVRVVDQLHEVKGVLRSGTRAAIEIEIVAEASGEFPCRFVIVLFTRDGKVLSRHCSDEVLLHLQRGQRHKASLVYEKFLLGNGAYFFSAAVYKELVLSNLQSAKAYDLLSRSFEFKVLDDLPDDPSVFHHPARWDLGPLS